ncbi:MAG: hypothetical protein AAFQ10_01710 [Pseudomonadota bacterium]
MLPNLRVFDVDYTFIPLTPTDDPVLQLSYSIVNDGEAFIPQLGNPSAGDYVFSDFVYVVSLSFSVNGGNFIFDEPFVSDPHSSLSTPYLIDEVQEVSSEFELSSRYSAVTGLDTYSVYFTEMVDVDLAVFSAQFNSGAVSTNETGIIDEGDETDNDTGVVRIDVAPGYSAAFLLEADIWQTGWNVGWYYGWGSGWNVGWYSGWGFGWNLGWYLDGTTWAYGWHTGWHVGWHVGWNVGWYVGWHYGWNSGWHQSWGWVAL